MGQNKRNGHIPVSQEKWVYEYLARLLSDKYFYSGLIGEKNGEIDCMRDEYMKS